jgi:hypothetical protein
MREPLTHTQKFTRFKTGLLRGIVLPLNREKLLDLKIFLKFCKFHALIRLSLL